MAKNFCYTIPDGEHKGETLWSGRYCCVAGFVFLIKDGEVFILANKRGLGAPDFQGMWNCPCGFLEGDENGQEGVSREVYEECGVKIDPSLFILSNVQTDPKESNKGHVTLRYYTILKDDNFNLVQSGGEENEVSEIAFIRLKDIFNYSWAFNHRTLILEMFVKHIM